VTFPQLNKLALEECGGTRRYILPALVDMTLLWLSANLIFSLGDSRGTLGRVSRDWRLTRCWDYQSFLDISLSLQSKFWFCISFCRVLTPLTRTIFRWGPAVFCLHLLIFTPVLLLSYLLGTETAYPRRSLTRPLQVQYSTPFMQGIFQAPPGLHPLHDQHCPSSPATRPASPPLTRYHRKQILNALISR